MMKHSLLLACVMALTVSTMNVSHAQGAALRNLDFMQLENLFNLLPPGGWSTDRSANGSYTFSYPYSLEFDSWAGRRISDSTYGVVHAIQLQGTLRITTADIANMVVRGAEGRLILPVVNTLMRALFHDGKVIDVRFHFHPSAVLSHENDGLLIKGVKLECRAASRQVLIEQFINSRCDTFVERHITPARIQLPAAMLNEIMGALGH